MSLKSSVKHAGAFFSFLDDLGCLQMNQKTIPGVAAAARSFPREHRLPEELTPCWLRSCRTLRQQTKSSHLVGRRSSVFSANTERLSVKAKRILSSGVLRFHPRSQSMECLPRRSPPPAFSPIHSKLHKGQEPAHFYSLSISRVYGTIRHWIDAQQIFVE